MFTVNTGGSISATVPSGAVSGPLTVSTSTGTATSAARFIVTLRIPPPPRITAFTPGIGSVGAKVTITGVNLAQTAIVSLGGVAAKFMVVSDTRLTLIVPRARTGLIVVTTRGGTAKSAKSFVVR